MFFDESGRFGTTHLYPAAKIYVLPLTRRGFFSEFNTLVNAVAFSLVEGRHIHIYTNAMNVDWRELMDLSLQDDVPLEKSAYPVRTRISLKTGLREAFDRMRETLSHLHARGRVKLPAIGFKNTLERLVAELTQAAFKPKAAIRKEAKLRMIDLGLEDQAFYAIHFRGGDKILGAEGDTRRVVEGEVTPLERYMTPILAETSHPKVFVLTDHYGPVEALRAAYPMAEFVTLCSPEQRGYFQNEYAAQDQAKRTADVRSLFVDVLIAERAKLYLGPYLSNVSLFVHQLRFPRPSLSVDSELSWTPFRTLPMIAKAETAEA